LLNLDISAQGCLPTRAADLLQAWHLARLQRQRLLHKRAELKRWPEPEQPPLGVRHPAFIGCKACACCTRTWPLRFFPKKPTSKDGWEIEFVIGSVDSCLQQTASVGMCRTCSSHLEFMKHKGNMSALLLHKWLSVLHASGTQLDVQSPYKIMVAAAILLQVLE
jgi:hypothetical protein